MNSSETFDLKAFDQLDQLGVRQPALFLSTSLPSQNDLNRDRQYAADIHVRRVRSAVSWLCRYLLDAGVQLVFGGHPEITPVILHAAHQAPASLVDEPLVFVFQSRFFEDVIPRESWELADWSRGRLVWTDARSNRTESLTFMRECMTRVSGLVGAVFMGGMDGLFEEVKLFEQNRPNFHDGPAPVYSLASTGGGSKSDLQPGCRTATGRA